MSGGQEERMNEKIDNVEAAQRKENFIKHHDYALKCFSLRIVLFIETNTKQDNSTD